VHNSCEPNRGEKPADGALLFGFPTNVKQLEIHGIHKHTITMTKQHKQNSKLQNKYTQTEIPKQTTMKRGQKQTWK
jgi:hypothetical protein